MDVWLVTGGGVEQRPAEELDMLIALQEGIGLERNEAWLGREADVLVDTIVPPRGHGHDEGPAADTVDTPAVPSLSGRTRGNKLVHLAGPEALVGHEVTVRIEHAVPNNAQPSRPFGDEHTSVGKKREAPRMRESFRHHRNANTRVPFGRVVGPGPVTQSVGVAALLRERYRHD